MSKHSKKFPTSWAKANDLAVYDWQKEIDYALAYAKETGRADKPGILLPQAEKAWADVGLYGTCACGQLDERIPREGRTTDACPLDDDLRRLGVLFYEACALTYTLTDFTHLTVGKPESKAAEWTPEVRHAYASRILKAIKAREAEILDGLGLVRL